MLITFKSRAAADVIMFGQIGQKMLDLIGKDPQDRQGIVTVAQLPAAIAALEAARSEDRTRSTDHQEEDEDAPRGMAATVSLAQRIVPLLELMGHALREEEPVLWEAT